MQDDRSLKVRILQLIVGQQRGKKKHSKFKEQYINIIHDAKNWKK